MIPQVSALGSPRLLNLPPWALPVLVPLLLGFLWLTVGPAWTLAGVLVGALILASLASHAWTLCLVLVGRTSLDLFYDQTLYVGAVKISAASVFSIVILALLLLVVFASKAPFPSAEGFRGFLLLMAGSAAGTIVAYIRFGESGNVALREMARLTVLFVWYVFLYQRARSTGEAAPFLRGVVLASLLPIGVGLWHVYAGIGVSTEGINRICSTFVDPNAFGFYLVFLIMFCSVRLVRGGGLRIWGLMGFSVFLLILTYSRGAWITMLISAPIFWFRMVRRRWVLVLGLLVVILAAYPVLSARLATVDYGDILVESQTGVTSNSYSFRMVIWEDLLRLWMDHPWIGWGLESTVIINPVRAMSDGAGAAAHNDGVRYLVESGLIGFSLYGAFLVMLGRALLRRSRELHGHALSHYARAALAIYAGFVLQSFTVSEPVHETIFMFHFLGLAAVLEGCADFAKVRRTLPVAGSGGVVP